MNASRRRDPIAYGRGWELATAAALFLLFFCCLAALSAVAVASQLFGGGWAWPHDVSDGLRALQALVTGEPQRWSSTSTRVRLAPMGAVYASLAVFEVAMLALLVRFGVAMSRRFRNDGMATRDEAKRALGSRQLLQAASVVRPDLVASRGSFVHNIHGRAQVAARALRRQRPKQRSSASERGR